MNDAVARIDSDFDHRVGFGEHGSRHRTIQPHRAYVLVPRGDDFELELQVVRGGGLGNLDREPLTVSCPGDVPARRAFVLEPVAAGRSAFRPEFALEVCEELLPGHVLVRAALEDARERVVEPSGTHALGDRVPRPRALAAREPVGRAAVGQAAQRRVDSGSR
jgi:hypothetical protein